MTVYEHLDGTLSIGYGPHEVGRYTTAGVLVRGAAGAVGPRQRGGALTSVALRAPSVSGK